MSSPSDLRAYLRSLDPATVIELLVRQAERSPELRRELELRAASQKGALDSADRLLTSPDLSSAGEGREYAAKVRPVLDTLERLLAGGTQADLTPLVRRTVDKIVDSVGKLPDSRGAAEIELDRAITLYARACVAHPPPAKQVAQWITGITLSKSVRAVRPRIELTLFGSVLDQKGFAQLKSAADKVLDGTTSATRNDDARVLAARDLLEQVAEVTGDVDALVAILAAKPPSAETNLKIVRALRRAGRHGEAIAYAARTLGTAKDASRMQQLSDEAPAKPKKTAKSPAAPKIVAKEDPIAAHREQIDALIATKEVSNYREAAQQLRKLRADCRRAGATKEFTAYVAELAKAHHRKTRLLAELHTARIILPKSVSAEEKV